ncbi:MAG: hypothetical protein HY774_09340 [Acidobacteria bacterium]|nr:hypothetical protein [Acidobacteriota bacterium]
MLSFLCNSVCSPTIHRGIIALGLTSTLVLGCLGNTRSLPVWAQTESSPSPVRISLVKQSARWHFERALILKAQDRPAHGVVELYRAQESLKLARDIFDTKFAGKELTKAQLAEREQIKIELDQEELYIQHLLGMLQRQNQRTVDAITALEFVIESPHPENVLARLELVRAYQDLKAWDKAFPHARRLIAILKVSDAISTSAMEQIRQTLPNTKQAGREATLEKAFRTLILSIEASLFADPVKFREYTLGQKVRDPLVYAELVQLFSEEDKTDEMKSMLEEAIRIQDGFCPIAYLSLGDMQETAGDEAVKTNASAAAQELYIAALKNYEIAIEQLKYLNFREEKGELDLIHIQDLQKKLNQLPKH